MASKKPVEQPINLLKITFHTLSQNPIIFFPFVVIAFIQFLLLELLFFAPRYPLSIFFGPIIAKLSGEIFLHYPYNFVLLGRWFQKFQIPIYFIVNSFFFGMAVSIINVINSDKTIRIKNVFRKTLSSYMHLIVASFVSVMVLLGFSKLYGLFAQRALEIRSVEGVYFILKQIILVGAPYFNLMFAVIVTTLFAFVIPIIIIENKKIFSAFIMNFKKLKRSFLLIFTIVFLSGLLYVPIFLFKSSSKLFQEVFPPEALMVMTIVSILTTLFIDAIQITAVTTYYLLKKEE